MAVVEIVGKSQYTYESDVLKVINYIADLSKCPNMIYGGSINIGSVFTDPEQIARQFIYVQTGRNCRRRVYHIVISFDYVLDRPNNKLLFQIGQAVAQMYPHYQSVFTVHENTNYPHIHMVLNNCSVFMGELTLTSIFNKYKVQEKVDYMIERNLGLI